MVRDISASRQGLAVMLSDTRAMGVLWALSSVLGEGGGGLRPARRAERTQCWVNLGAAEEGLNVVLRKPGQEKLLSWIAEVKTTSGRESSRAKRLCSLLWTESTWSHVGRDHRLLVLQGVTATLETP